MRTTRTTKVPVAVAQALKSAATAISPTGFLEYRDYLSALYHWLKNNLDRYSYVQFASDLGFGKTNVAHLIIQGKRPLSVKAAERIAASIELGALDKEYLVTLVRYQNARSPRQREELFDAIHALKNRLLKSSLDRSQLEYFSEWYHPVIREMTFMTEFDSDPDWIAAKIFPRIRPEQARKSLALLESLNLIRFDGALNRHVPTAARVSTGDEVASIAVIRYHQQSIALGRDAMTSVSEDRRDISAVTVCVSEAMAQRMKVEVQAFRKKILAMADEVKKGDQVYQLNIQLYPLTKV